MQQLVDYLLVVVRRKMLFMMALAVIMCVAFIASGGWSWPAFIILMFLLFGIVMYWVLINFWIAVFRGANKPEAK
jgi:uncharacterized protein (DUF58 family)